MLKAMLRGLLAHKLRLILSALAIVLGTMFMSGAFIAGHTIDKGVTDLFSSINSNIDVQVTAKSSVGSVPGGGDSLVTKTVPQSIADKIATVDGVAQSTPQVYSDGARVINKTGKVEPSTGAPRLGAGWGPNMESTGIRLREGAAPASPDQIAISANLAKATGYGIGDRVEVITLQPRKPFTVTGITEMTDGRESQGGETYVFFTEPVAQQLMLGAGPGNYSNVDVKAKDGVTPDALKQQVQTAVGDEYTVLTGKETAEVQAGPIQLVLGVLTTVLAAFGILALFTGLFLIFNTFSMLIAQRTRELALYRSFGANRGQVLRSVLLESAILGLLSSIVGLIIGAGIGYLIKSVIGSLGGMQLPGGIVVKPWVIIATLLAGTLITIIAALIPAVRAASVAPIEAMREAAKPDKPLHKRTIAGLVVLALGIVTMVLLATKTWELSTARLGLGAALTFIGTVMLAPILCRPITRAIGKLVDWTMPGGLGVRNTGRNPRRTALTAAALMIGVTLATGAGVFAYSAKAGLKELFEQDLNANLMFLTDQAAGPTAGFDPALGAKVAQIPGVTAAAALRVDVGRLGNQDAFLTAADTGALATLYGIAPAAGEVRKLNKGEVLLPEEFAKQANLSVGSTATMETARQAPETLRVVGIMKPNTLVGGPLISLDDAAGFRSPLAQQAYVKVDDPAQLESVRSQMTALIADNPEVAVTDPRDQLKQVNSFFDILLTILNVLLGLTVLVAILGVINTLLLSVFERTRELGLLRAIGMNRSKVGWMIAIESVLISLFGALLGMVVGMGLGIAIVKILGSDFLKLTIPWSYLIFALIGAVIAGLIAAMLPAARAARLNVLEAISYE